jgi:hypothetical protein
MAAVVAEEAEVTEVGASRAASRALAPAGDVGKVTAGVDGGEETTVA